MKTEHVDDKLEHINPSWKWGIMHVIDYHHWHCNLKRLLSHGKNQGRRPKSHGSPKRRATHHDSGEMHMLQHEEEIVSPVDRSHKGSASIHKRSLKARIKALIANQTHKEGNDKQRGPRLERTYAIHHLEPSDHGFGGGTKNLQDPTRKPDAGGEEFNKLGNMTSEDKLKEHADVLEMFKVKKDLFLEMLKNADNGIKKLSRTLPASNAKSRLTKSGSFPAGNLSRRRNLGSSKLKHKQNEIWPAPLGEKYSIDVLYNSKNFLSRSGSSADSSGGVRLGRALSLILQSTIESEKERPTDFVIPLKENKKAFEFEGVEGKKETNSSLSVLGEVSNGEGSSTVEKDFAESSADSRMNREDGKISSRSHERDDIGSRNSTFSYRRSSSLNESLDKYASLFESNFGKEVKLRSSKSLRLSNENEKRSSKSSPALYKRIRSLSQQDEFYSFLENVVQVGGIFGDWPFTSVKETSKDDNQNCELKPKDFSTSTGDCVAPDETKEPQNENEMIEKINGIQPVDKSAESEESIADECRGRMEDLPEKLTFHESNPFRDEEANNSESTYRKFPESSCPVAASKNNSQDEASSNVFPHEQLGMGSRCDSLYEDSSINLRDGIERVSSSLLDSRDIVIPDHSKAMEKNTPNEKDDNDLEYVRDLLERSGFTTNALRWKWHSLDQPLSPSVFEETEVHWHQELECTKEEDLWSYYHHQLLFELVNEELARLCDESWTYYPKAISSSCHIHHFPIGDRLPQEIFSRIVSLMSLKPEQMQSLDSVISFDLKKNDGWMNLQLESEGLALEIEDMIFDELLEELV